MASNIPPPTFRSLTPETRPSLLDRLALAFGQDIDDSDIRIRTHVFLLYSALLLFMAFVWGASHFDYGSSLVGFTFFGCGLVIAGIVYKFWRDHNLRMASYSLMTAALIGVSLSTYFTGGLRMSNVCPFFMLLVASIFLLGRRGLLWALADFATPLLFQLAHWFGFPFPDHIPPDNRSLDAFLTWFSALVVVLIFVLFYERSRVLAIRRLQEANLAKSQFLANMGHEIRTPLHVIMGMNRLLKGEELNTTQLAHVETSQQSAEALLHLLGDLIDLASIEYNRFSIQSTDFDPIELTENITSGMRYPCQEKGLDLFLEVDHDVPAWVRGDSRRLKQVLTNLVSNAIKFTEEGSIVIHLRSPRRKESPYDCTFIISDTGVGIPLQDQERIFESFTQVDGSLTRRYGGAGLGLFISQKIVQLMGGRIKVESQPQEGSRFFFTLPFEAPLSPKPVEEEPFEDEPSFRYRLRVLVVEDSKINQKLAQLMLRRLFQEAIVAHNGREAIELWEKEDPDLILMDLQMPLMDGLEATKVIREREAKQKQDPIPIVAMTGHATEQHWQLCLAAGMNDCITKPFSLEELRKILKRCIERQPLF